MALMEWGPQYSLGDQELDEQHRVLFEMTARISTRTGRRTANMIDELSALMLYASEHFYCEEVLMSRVDYPDLQAHHLGHAEFQKQLMEFATKVQTARVSDWDHLGTLAASWMRTHVLNGDMAFRSHLLRMR